MSISKKGDLMMTTQKGSEYAGKSISIGKRQNPDLNINAKQRRRSNPPKGHLHPMDSSEPIYGKRNVVACFSEGFIEIGILNSI
jgi:hypothetical protein